MNLVQITLYAADLSRSFEEDIVSDEQQAGRSRHV